MNNHIEKFNQLANHYDTPKNIYMAKLAVDAIRRYKVPKSPNKAADLGCGTGLIGLNLLEDFDSMLLVDGASNMLDIVNEKIKKQETKSNADTLQLNMEDELILPEKMDTLILSLVLHHISDHEQILTDLYNNLNVGGQLFIIEMAPSPHNHHGVDYNKLSIQLSDIGFQDIQFEVIYDADNENDDQTASRFILTARK